MAGGWVDGPAGPASGLPASGTPAHGNLGNRDPAPYVSGNVLSLSTGTRSPRVYGQLATDLARGLLADRPDLANYPEALASWATAEALVTLFRRQLAQQGPTDGKGQPRAKLMNEVSRWEKHARLARQALGLDPTSEVAIASGRARLGQLQPGHGDVLAAVVAAGREALLQREAQQAGGQPPPPAPPTGHTPPPPPPDLVPTDPAPLHADDAGRVLAQVRAEGHALAGVGGTGPTPPTTAAPATTSEGTP